MRLTHEREQRKAHCREIELKSCSVELEAHVTLPVSRYSRFARSPIHLVVDSYILFNVV
jgi:hypothetical protein